MDAKASGQNQTGQGDGTPTPGPEGTQSGTQDTAQCGAASDTKKRRTQ